MVLSSQKAGAEAGRKVPRRHVARWKLGLADQVPSEQTILEALVLELMVG
jgi:hypothetical protein